MEQDLSVKAKNEIEKIIQEMEDDALSCLTNFGAAHSKADLENQMPNSYQAAAEKNKKRALLRGKEALKDLQLQRQQENFDRNKKIITRKNALDTEAVRSSYIVSLPPVKFVEPKKKEEVHPKVMLFDKGSLYQTEYELKGNIVEKITSPKVNILLTVLKDSQRFLRKIPVLANYFGIFSNSFLIFKHI